ncbi:glycerol-3-phosphate dehydrogenase subunit C [Vibrio penaeicida]|uniref:Glycerol-3-phosphate dehydrogenase subunit C n=1 Tax=Vibrio penaeicida TaxID=104609 RepID=A0AAV5NSL6_9VIBR|nr:glycerol-3-phosphate dehydrogenase subunit C [Vibrio penaeicida]GLQ73430.1 glycerol-3-phosphate dehydrogenase subunit C [Vibrio penaeicida]
MGDTVNAQVTDSVTQVNTKVVGETPAMAMGNLLMSTSQALGTAAHNSTADQQQAQITMQAATVQGVIEKDA